jgi:hypothetical protein
MRKATRQVKSVRDNAFSPCSFGEDNTDQTSRAVRIPAITDTHANTGLTGGALNIGMTLAADFPNGNRAALRRVADHPRLMRIGAL